MNIVLYIIFYIFIEIYFMNLFYNLYNLIIPGWFVIYIYQPGLEIIYIEIIFINNRNIFILYMVYYVYNLYIYIL